MFQKHGVDASYIPLTRLEWGEVTFQGYEVDLDVGDMDEVENYLIDQQMEGFFDE
jgi:hypothetical protein